jgi:preprotein translocase subunit SecE
MKQPASKQAVKSSRFGFIGATIAELRKVVWPTRRETIYLTTMVLVVAIAVGAVLGVIDFGFSFGIEKIFVPE